MAKLKHAKSLRDLPTDRRHAEIMADLTRPTNADRSVAILGAAYVDLVLRDAIIARLEQRDRNLMQQLFEDRGPLQPFGSRIQIAYALGIYRRRVYDDLRTIKEIRNAFAHAAEDVGFADAPIRERANALHLIKIGFKGRPAPTTPRARYVHTVEMVTDCLIADVSRRASGMRGETILRLGPP